MLADQIRHRHSGSPSFKISTISDSVNLDFLIGSPVRRESTNACVQRRGAYEPTCRGKLTRSLHCRCALDGGAFSGLAEMAVPCSHWRWTGKAASDVLTNQAFGQSAKRCALLAYLNLMDQIAPRSTPKWYGGSVGTSSLPWGWLTSGVSLSRSAIQQLRPGAMMERHRMYVCHVYKSLSGVQCGLDDGGGTKNSLVAALTFVLVASGTHLSAT